MLPIVPQHNNKNLYVALLLAAGLHVLLVAAASLQPVEKNQSQPQERAPQPNQQPQAKLLQLQLPAEALKLAKNSPQLPQQSDFIPQLHARLRSLLMDSSNTTQAPEQWDWQSAFDNVMLNPQIVPGADSNAITMRPKNPNQHYFNLLESQYREGELEDDSTAQAREQQNQTPQESSKAAEADPALAEKNQDQASGQPASQQQTDTPPAPKPTEIAQAHPDNNAQGEQAPSQTAQAQDEFGPPPDEVLADLLKTAKQLELPDPTAHSQPEKQAEVAATPPAKQQPQPEQQQQQQAQAPKPQQNPQTPAATAANNPAQQQPEKPKDPSMRANSRFQSQQRASASVGSFNSQGKAALASKATEQGRYEQQVYNAIAKEWLIHCTQRRDVIVPGEIRLRVVLDPQGKVQGIDQIEMSNASALQKGFTIKSIRQAAIPAMSQALRKQLGNGNLEFFYTFFF